jgi:CTP:molybdopterin cytidylyltransferase MocA
VDGQGSGQVVGLLLAAGAGRRMGQPKALVEDAQGLWLPRAVAALRAGGCDHVVVVLGAEADRARELVPAGVAVVVAHDWDDGMGRSLATGLAALAREVVAALVHLVDLPDVGGDVVARLRDGAEPDSLRRATYAGRPGHPVLLGRDHWAGVGLAAAGDRGARDYLASHPHDEVECGDLATGRDVDTPKS